ncbi:glycosyl transferase [Phytohabitans rumicis]|uniref:Glycosyl transferase n=1 Tax=Phytohabitans rumicis TaxID=1076125 RepID=A0A6V8LA90_9ACTN|nr:glycosyl transferase [Phytohabitans rumicis]
MAAQVRPYAPDLAICLVFVALAGWVTHGLWPDPGGRVLALNPEDQTLYEWFLATDTKFYFGDWSLLTERLNAPSGVNLLANTTVIALGALFTPVTLIFGVPVTFALIAGGNLAGTAIAWYFLFTRTLGASRLAAGLGAGLCGFGPGIVSQNNSHLHMTAQFLVPVLVYLVVRLARAADPSARPEGVDRRRVVTSGLWLAFVVTVQVFIGEEVLFLTAVTLAVLTLTYAVARRDFARRVLPWFLAGMGVAVGAAGVLLAYPLWFQFAGPLSVPNGVFSPHYFSADLASWSAISPLSIAGSNDSARLSTGSAEYNTFLGWPLILVALACAIRMIRRPLVVAVTLTGILMAWLSLGPDIVINGKRTDIPGPYAVLVGVPVVDGALPMRFALALLPLVAVLLVLAIDQARRSTWPRWLMPGAVVVALLPIFPAPLPTTDRPALPEFISGGHWRSCVKPGGVMVPVPIATPPQPWAMRWAAAANVEFGMPEGFFIGPYGAKRRASMGTYKRPTSQLLADVAKDGGRPGIGEDQLRMAREDLAFWGASCVVLTDDAPHRDDLQATLEALLGPGTRVADAWTWKM